MSSSAVQDFRSKLDQKLIDGEYSEEDLQRVNSDDNFAQCFINWRKGDVDTAVDLALTALKWRKDHKICDLHPDNLDKEAFNKGILFSHGTALDGTRIVCFIARRQTKDMKPLVQPILFYWLNRIQQAEPGKHITFLLDASKTGLSNVDVDAIRVLLDCFSTYFPDMLAKMVILEMPWILNAVWKIVKQWLTEEQRKRIQFCSFKELPELISEENTLKDMGGKDEWEFSYPPHGDGIDISTSSSDAANDSGAK